MSENLKDTVKQSASFWRRLVGGQNSGIIKMIIERCQKHHKNYKGEKFAPYSADYAEAKGSGDKAKLGIVGQRQESKSTTPDMTLTNKMLWGLKIQTADENSATFGWTGPNAEKVENLHGKKNYQIIGLEGEQILDSNEEKYIIDEMEKYIGKKIDTWANRTITIDIRKK